MPGDDAVEEDHRKYLSFEVTRSGAVVTVRFRSPETRQKGANIHWELAEFVSDLRGDNDTRVVVLTGMVDGEFLAAPKTDTTRTEGAKTARGDPRRLWRTFTGVVRFHEAMAALEKPVVARVNGDAVGFGQSVMFACDLIVARSDARIADMHLGLGDVKPYGAYYGLVPGDGGLIYAPLYMPPAIAKEYLLLAREYSAVELARMGVINYAVPAGEIDEVVSRLVGELLRRPSYALAWTKRLLNRAVATQVAAVADAAAAYEAVNFLEMERFGWADPHEL